MKPWRSGLSRVLFILGLVAGGPALAQEDSREPSAGVLRLEDFQLSGPPALVLLGIAPSTVVRPATPRALIASLVSATGSSGIVPNGYAMETAPYWLRRHPSLQLREYYNPSPADRLRYFTAISAATSRPSSKSDTVRPDAHVSVAVRSLLLNGRPSPALVGLMESMRKQQIDYINAYRRWESVKSAASPLAAQRRRLVREEDLLSTLVTRVLVGPEGELRDSTMRTLARRDSARAAVARAESATDEVTKLESEMDRIDGRLSALGEDFSAEDLEPDGLVLEVAAGTRAVFEHGEWSSEKVDGIGVWLTPMYRLAAHHLTFAATGRYLSRVAEYGGRSLFDVGARIGFDVSKATVSAEYARRRVSAEETTLVSSARWAALFTYSLPARLQLVASFGSDFRRLNGDRPLIATIGLDLGLGAIMLRPQSGTR